MSGADHNVDTLFTPGPVMMHDHTRRAGGKQMIYHRTHAFSRRLLNCERMLKHACGARADDRMVMLAGSGTAAMEAVVINLFGPQEKLFVVNSGEFGHRFVEICRLHGYGVVEVKLEPGRQIREEDLYKHDVSGCAGLLVNHHETSTGSLLDLNLIARFSRERELLLVVDGIGSFLGDPISVEQSGIDALIVSSQKGLALPPGMSFIVLSCRAMERVRMVKSRSYYLGFGKYLDDIQRGQTPFTPPVGIVTQLEGRLEHIVKVGMAGITQEVQALANDFRHRVRGLPFRLFPECPSNALTALAPTNGTAPENYVQRLAEEYGLFVCPNAGALKDIIFRVGHLGDLSMADNARLVSALTEIAKLKPGRLARCSAE